MAINPTSSATSGVTSTSALGKGTTIDIDTIVSKLDAIEQAPIDKLGIRVTKQENALADLGTIKSKMAIFQAALQDLPIQ